MWAQTLQARRPIARVLMPEPWLYFKNVLLQRRYVVVFGVAIAENELRVYNGTKQERCNFQNIYEDCEI